jgi:hypothetical protein
LAKLQWTFANGKVTVNLCFYFLNRSCHRSTTFARHIPTENKSIGQWKDHFELSIEKIDQYVNRIDFDLSHIVHLLADECYAIGRVAYANGDFYHTLMWMQEALDRFEYVFISKIDILDIFANATFQVDD